MLSPSPSVARSTAEAWPVSTVSTTAKDITATWPTRMARAWATMPRVIVASAHAHVLHDAPLPSPRARPHDVEVPAGVAPDAVARAEAGIAPLGEALTLERQHAEQAAVVFGDVDDVVGVHVEDRRPDQLRGPHAQELACLVEHLHAVVLAVADEHAP